MRLLLTLLLCTTAAHADTLGLLPCTAPVAEAVVAKPKGKPRIVVAHGADEWRAAWTAAGGAGKPLAVDFDRQIVVGVITAAKDVIYRIELDSAVSPTALQVRVGASDAPCAGGRTRAAVGAHFVVTPRTALPVHFLLDGMEDVHLYVSQPDHEGVDTSDLGTVAAVAVKGINREDAEHAVTGALSAAEKTRLANGPLDRPLKRLPHGWTKVAVTREADRWLVQYDDLAFAVDATTGAVSRR